MLNNRDDDKFEVGEESEYHFSDDDISYEVETETPTPEKPEAATPGRENIVTRLSSSKRMLISLVIFLVLVFIVYRMVMPTTNQPATTITPPVISHQAPHALPENAPAPVTVTTEQQPYRAEAPLPVTSMPAAAPIPVTSTTVPTSYPQTTTTTTVTTPTAPMQTTTSPPEHTQTMPAQATTQTTTNAPAFTQVTPPGSLPNVMPVKEPTPPPALPTSMPTMPALTNQTEQMMNQMNAEQKQRLDEFASQNTMIQSQIKTLNDRVAAMEAQLNQIMQAISRPTVSTPAPTPPTPVHATPIESMPEPISMHDRKLSSYMVQAIIPGRAWLRLSNGETMTIAEGDPIRGLGRVSKIDPYNGVIEVNTGTKIISISYGNSS